MTKSEALKTLVEYQQWRQSDKCSFEKGAPKMPKPKIIGEALDVSIKALNGKKLKALEELERVARIYISESYAPDCPKDNERWWEVDSALAALDLFEK